MKDCGWRTPPHLNTAQDRCASPSRWTDFTSAFRRHVELGVFVQTSEGAADVCSHACSRVQTDTLANTELGGHVDSWGGVHVKAATVVNGPLLASSVQAPKTNKLSPTLLRKRGDV